MLRRYGLLLLISSILNPLSLGYLQIGAEQDPNQLVAIVNKIAQFRPKLEPAVAEVARLETVRKPEAEKRKTGEKRRRARQGSVSLSVDGFTISQSSMKRGQKNSIRIQIPALIQRALEAAEN